MKKVRRREIQYLTRFLCCSYGGRKLIGPSFPTDFYRRRDDPTAMISTEKWRRVD